MSSTDSLDFVADKYRADLALPETEDTWERIAKALVVLKTVCHNGNYSSTTGVVQVIRSLHTVIKQSLLSERTRLSSAALDLIDSVASACQTDFEALIPTFFSTLMVLTGRTNKVVITRTKACVLHIIDCTQSPSLLPHFLNHLQEKSASMRLISAQCALAYMKCCNPPDLEKESRACDIENLIRKTARDANADVRNVGREIFGAYKILLPHRVDRFTAPLTPTIRKYLDIKSSNQISSKAAISRVKSISSLAAAQNEKKPESRHGRTPSVTVSDAAERETRLPSSAAARLIRAQASTKINVVASKPESSRHGATASSGTSTGPSRVLASSTETARVALSRTRTLPLPGPQRTVSGTIVPSSSSTTLASSGPRRVPLPNPVASTQSVVPKRPLSRPASQQSNVGSGISRPTSQQSRPINLPTKSTAAKPTTSRAMLPPKTRADGSATGITKSSKVAASNTLPEPMRRPRAGLMQPTASQLAKVKALVIQKGPVKKAGVVSTKPVSKPTVLHKSSKANVAGEPEISAATLPMNVALPPSPEPTPLPELVLEEVKSPEVLPLKEPLQEAQVDPVVSPEFVLTCSDGEPQELPNTPTNLLLHVHDWNVQNTKTPISALLTSIQQGFEFSPASPLSPPHTYLNSEIQPLVPLL